MKAIADIHTSCKNCIFAIYDNLTQTDCGLNFIEKYKTKNISIVEAYDEDKEFYIINDKKCIGYRRENWLSNNGLAVNSTIAEKTAKFKELNHIDYIVIIDTKEFSFDDFVNTIESIRSSGIPPKKLYLIRHPSNTEFAYEKLEQLLNSLSYPWKIQTCIDESPFAYFINYIIMLNKDSRFVLTLNKCDQDVAKVILKANNIVHENLDQFIVVANSIKTSQMFSNSVYKYDKVTGQNLLGDEQNYILV